MSHISKNHNNIMIVTVFYKFVVSFRATRLNNSFKAVINYVAQRIAIWQWTVAHKKFAVFSKICDWNAKLIQCLFCGRAALCHRNNMIFF